MSLFDDAVNAAKKTARNVGKMAGDALEVSKLHLNAADIKSEINDRYTRMGKLCYDTILNSREHATEIKILADEIVAKTQDLEKVNADIRKAKNMIVCTQCGAQIEANSVFCPKCGHNFNQ